MDREEIVSKMKELREMFELKYIKEEMEEKKDTFKKVGNVKYLGNIEIDEQIIPIYLVLEQEFKNDGTPVFESYNCYTEDGNFIGRLVDQYDMIAIKEQYSEIDGLYDQVNSLDKNGILDLNKIEKAELEEIAKALGIDENDIKAMSSMELAQKIEEKQDAKINPEEEKEDDEQEEEKQLNKEETKKITDGKQEIKLGTKVDEYKTLGQALDLNESEYSKVVIVYSDKLKQIQDESEPINNTTYSFVAIKKDGTAQIINDRLRVDPRSGNNSFKDALKIDADKTARKDDKTKTRFQIIGKNGQNEGKADKDIETLSVENGQYGEVKAYYGKGRTIDGNMNIETQLETSNVKPTSIEMRQLQADRKGIYNNDKMAEEGNKHFDNGEEKVSMYSVDGDENTLILSDYVEHNKEAIIAQMMANETIANSQFGEKDIEDKLTRSTEDDKEKPYTQKEIEEKIKDIEQELADDAANFPERNRK